MNCRKFERWIVFGLEDELTPRQKKILERHLKECVECRKALEDYRNVRRLFAALPEEPIPFLPPNIRPVTKKRLFPLLRPVVLAPAVIAICLILTVGIIKFRTIPLSVPPQNVSETNLFADVSETEFFEVNFPRSADYQYFIENLSADEQEEFFGILNEI